MPTEPLPRLIHDILRKVFNYFAPPKSSGPHLIPFRRPIRDILRKIFLYFASPKSIGPLPRLNPDVLREVFLYFAPPNSSGPDLIPLDLFACSLVCKYWYVEARPLLDRYTSQSLFLDSRYTSDELRRIADLFIEFKRNGLDYLKKIDGVLIDIISLTASDREFKISMPAVQTILAYLPPNLTRISIASTSTANASLINSYQHQEITSLLIVTRAHLHDGFSSPRNHINDITTLLSLRLKFPKLNDVTTDAQTYDTSRLRNALRKLEFDGVSGNGLSSVVQLSSELRLFPYAYDDIIMSTVHLLVRSCLQPESFTILASHIRLDPFIYYGDLLRLPTFAPMLTRVDVTHNNFITDDTMKAILTIKAPRLEYLNLDGCTLFTGISTPLQAGVWPALKTLSLNGCRRVRMRFVTSVVVVCHCLKEIGLPDHLGPRVASFKLEPHGFQYTQGNVWRR